MNRTFYYARVSSCEQNLDRQLEAFAKLGAEDREIVTDKESGFENDDAASGRYTDREIT